MKQCTKCKKKKEFSEFGKDNSTKDKKTLYCRKCNSIQSKKRNSSKQGKEKLKRYYQENKEKIIEYSKIYQKNNRERRKKWLKKKQKDKKWKERNRILVRSCMRRWQKKHAKNPKYRLDNNVCWGINKCLKGTKAYRTWESLVGYTLQDLIHHLEKQFDDKMNWQNYGSYWHIDHIVPKSWFPYQTAEEQAFRNCWGLANLQPLEANENRSKNNRFIS